MKVIRSINNNAALCIDDNGNELVAIGKGVGFPAVPYTLTDLSKIQRTYYGINPMYFDLINQIDEKIFEISGRIVESFREKCDLPVSSNLVFTLADHINFTIERSRKNIQIANPLIYDVRHLYEKEYSIGLEALRIINDELGVRLVKNEAGGIALHLVNAQTESVQGDSRLFTEQLIEETSDIVAEHFNIELDRQDFNYSRFVSHLQYLIKREENDQFFSSENHKMFDQIREAYPETFECVRKIAAYFKEKVGFDLSDEEQLYLMLHVNRLVARVQEEN